MLYTMIVLLVVAAIAYLVIRSHPSDKGIRAWGVPENGVLEDAKEESDPTKLPGAVFSESVKNIKLYSAFAWCFIKMCIRDSWRNASAAENVRRSAQFLPYL